MDYDPISYLGLYCPSGGDFYICQGNRNQFLGCCDVDPCDGNGGLCPVSAIHPSSFDRDKYSEIPPQSCISSTRNGLWYTCSAGPTFLGCCVSNPCNNDGVCPQNNLVGAVLNGNQNSASVFLTTPTLTSTSTSTSPTQTSTTASTSTSLQSTSSSGATVSSTSSPYPSAFSSGGSSPPIAGIVGGILGGVIALGLIALVFFLYRRGRRRKLATTQSDKDATATPQPWSPYQDSFHSSSAVTPAPVSPPSTVSTPRSLSATFGSIIGLKRSGGRKRWSSRSSAGRNTIDEDWLQVAHDNRLAGQGFLSPVMELDSSPMDERRVARPSHTGYHEVEGSVPAVRQREMGS
ncbi:hypothetical protein F5Y07DRAFT_251583 [Xylaria sp. FL0933]|nr:hypothetical protein F5Y07DRAFT_251583 [Xylaria sp. FL0933]